MKHGFLFPSAMVVLMTACGFHTQENKEVTPKPATPQNQTAPRTQVQVNVGDAKIPADLISSIEASSNNLRKLDGAKPGKVILAGMIISQSQTEEDSALKIDSHLQVPSNSEANSLRTMDENELENIDKATDRKTYINIGCKDSQVGAQQIAGLQKALMQMHGTFKHAHADKIFLCGNDAMTMKNIVIYANEIIMNNASFVISHGDNGLIIMGARVLTLLGQNRINSITKNVDGTLAPGSPIFLSVLDDVSGSGSLLINQ